MQTEPGDLVLIHHRDKAVGFARVEEIIADVKPGWWQIRLLLLQVPLQLVTWILREEYIDGGQFTMNGEPMRLELQPRLGAMEPPPPPDPGTEDKGEDEDGGTSSKGKAKVVSLNKRRRSR
ncbi:MAG: hypothetical protein PVG03_08190 [Desulfarculaceae bacterium]|jgi:hypothetical protein